MTRRRLLPLAAWIGILASGLGSAQPKPSPSPSPSPSLSPTPVPQGADIPATAPAIDTTAQAPTESVPVVRATPSKLPVPSPTQEAKKESSPEPLIAPPADSGDSIPEPAQSTAEATPTATPEAPVAPTPTPSEITRAVPPAPSPVPEMPTAIVVPPPPPTQEAEAVKPSPEPAPSPEASEAKAEPVPSSAPSEVPSQVQAEPSSEPIPGPIVAAPPDSTEPEPKPTATPDAPKAIVTQPEPTRSETQAEEIPLPPEVAPQENNTVPAQTQYVALENRIPPYQLARPTCAIELEGTFGGLGNTDLSQSGKPGPAGVNAEFDYQPESLQNLGVFGFGPQLGVYPYQHSAGVSTSFMAIFEMGGQLRYQARYFREQIVVPEIAFEGQFINYSLQNGESGHLLGKGVTLGALVNMNVFEPSAAREMFRQYNVSRTYAAFEFKNLTGSDSNVSFSGSSLFFGLRTEF